MKATFQIPDALYREVKAETAREGRTLREVAISLFERWLEERRGLNDKPSTVDWNRFEPPLAGLISKDVKDHSMESMRDSIAKHWDEPL